jgi:ribosomal protein S18 acetylase RimI-like enzyme
MDTNDIVIERVIEFSSDMADAVRNLVKQLVSNYKPFSDDEFREMVQNPQSFLFIAREVVSNKVAGVVMIIIYRIPDSKKVYLDDIIVDENFRGNGIATLLFNKVIAIARDQKADYIELTSNPKRAAGIHLYEKLGFKKRETNVYRLPL